MSEYGAGWVVSTRDGSNPLDANQMFAMSLANNAATQGVIRVDSLANAGAPDAVGGTAGLFSNVDRLAADAGQRRRCPRSASGSRRRGRASDPRWWCPRPRRPDRRRRRPRRLRGRQRRWRGRLGAGGRRRCGRSWPRSCTSRPGGLHALQTLAYARGSHPLLSWSPVQRSMAPRYRCTSTGFRSPRPARRRSGSPRSRRTALTTGRSWPSIRPVCRPVARSRPCSSTASAVGEDFGPGYQAGPQARCTCSSATAIRRRRCRRPPTPPGSPR